MTMATARLAAHPKTAIAMAAPGDRVRSRSCRIGTHLSVICKSVICKPPAKRCRGHPRRHRDRTGAAADKDARQRSAAPGIDDEPPEEPVAMCKCRIRRQNLPTTVESQ
jgi:hypothetical protein